MIYRAFAHSVLLVDPVLCPSCPGFPSNVAKLRYSLAHFLVVFQPSNVKTIVIGRVAFVESTTYLTVCLPSIKTPLKLPVGRSGKLLFAFLPTY